MNASASTSKAPRRDWFRIAVLAAQTFFGTWFVIHGLNHWVHFFPQPPGSDSLTSQLIRVMIDTGLFDLIKAGEVLSGALMLLHRFVPFAIVTAVPAAVVIAYINLFLNTDFESRMTAIAIIILLGLMCLGYIRSFAGLLQAKTDEPKSISVGELTALLKK